MMNCPDSELHEFLKLLQLFKSLRPARTFCVVNGIRVSLKQVQKNLKLKTFVNVQLQC